MLELPDRGEMVPHAPPDAMLGTTYKVLCVSEIVGARKTLLRAGERVLMAVDTKDGVAVEAIGERCGAFLRSGAAVVIREGEMRVVRWAEGAVRNITTVEIPARRAEVLDLVPGEGPTDWGLVFADGTVERYRLV